MKRTLSLLPLLLLLLVVNTSNATTTITLGVGESYTLPAPTHYGATIYSAAWSSNSTNVTVQNLAGFQARITIVNVFTGNVRITCHFAYSWTDADGYPHTGSNYEYYLVECSSDGGGGGGGSGSGNETGVSIDPISMTINIDDNFANYIGACAIPISAQTTFSWTTTNSSVATVSVYQNDGYCSNAYVDAHGVGTCYIKVTTANGYTKQCLVTVTSGSGGGGGGSGDIGTYFVSDGISYKITSTTSCEVSYDYALRIYSGVPSYEGHITIPDQVSYNGILYNVTGIGLGAFYQCIDLLSVEIPSSVTYIGQNAFGYCIDLDSVIIPNSVTYIGQNAFQNCYSLSSITIPNSVTSISSDAFVGCGGLPGIEVSQDNSVYSSSDGVLYNKNKTTLIYCPTGFTDSLFIPSSVTSIEEGAFKECYSLTKITVSSSNTYFSSDDGILYNKAKTTLVCCPAGRSSAVSIPSTVRTIKNYAFANCTKLWTVSVPTTVTTIGGYSFEKVRMIFYNGNNILIYNGYPSYSPWGAHCNNGYIEDSLYYSNSAKTYLVGAHGDITHATIPNTVTEIRGGAFRECVKLSSVTLPNTITKIRWNTFDSCINLTSINIPNSVTDIEVSAFANCRSLDSITIPNSITTIGTQIFRYCMGLIHVNIQNTRTGIGTFMGCKNLNSVTFSNSTTTIEKCSFTGCKNLANLNIPNSITEIGIGAFRGCTNLTSVYIPSSVRNIKYYAFGSALDVPLTLLMGSTNPPSIDELYSSIGAQYNGLSIVVPHSAYNIYSASYSYRNYHVISDTIFIKHTVNDTTRGYVIGEDTMYTYPYNEISNMMAFAVPYYGYHFDKWDDNSNDSIRLVLANTLTHDLAITAYFEKNQYVVRAIVDSVTHGKIRPSYTNTAYEEINDLRSYLDVFSLEVQPNYGYHFIAWNDGDTNNPRVVTLIQDTAFTAFFAPNQYTLTVQSDDETTGRVAGCGSYDYLDTVIISATGINHHHFVHWSDGNRDNPRRFVIAGDTILTAFFAIDTHLVNVVPNDPVRGMVTQSGTEFVYLTPCTVEATAYTGYTFAGWSNGVTANPYTFAVLSDVELTALFVAEGEAVYTVSVVSANPTMGTASGGGQALYGGEVTIRATANEGYRFVRWNDNDTHAVRTVTVTADATYTAYFEALQGIDKIETTRVKIEVSGLAVKVDNPDGETVRIYDIAGRMLQTTNSQLSTTNLPTAGVYVVKVAGLPARKIVLVR